MKRWAVPLAVFLLPGGLALIAIGWAVQHLNARTTAAPPVDRKQAAPAGADYAAAMYQRLPRAACAHAAAKLAAHCRRGDLTSARYRQPQQRPQPARQTVSR